MDAHNVFLSLIPMDKPIPKIGDIKGEINMAPMMTAGELTFKPMEAMQMAQMSNHTLAPLVSMFFWMPCSVPLRSNPSRKSKMCDQK